MGDITDIYILRLEQGKYYIGKSANAESRVEAHMAGNGSYWTKKYKPIETLKIIKNGNVFDEDRYTKEYMATYGIDNVRGGSYVTMKLSDEQKNFLTREIWGAKDLCARCGKSGHFIRECKETMEETPIITEDAKNTITITIPKPVMAAKAWISATFTKMQYQLTNPESDLRSGRLFKKT